MATTGIAFNNTINVKGLCQIENNEIVNELINKLFNNYDDVWIFFVAIIQSLSFSRIFHNEKNKLFSFADFFQLRSFKMHSIFCKKCTKVMGFRYMDESLGPRVFENHFLL